MATDATDARSAAQSDESPIIKPEADARSYLFLTLPNRLRVMLVSDLEADKAAACMDVHVGSVSDPEKLPGLAHFLEHMLFLGTEKFPKEGEYHEFLSAHGGAHNAYTA
ncbi:Metalloenzyme, LuxS/M16 peptidase-like protein, partial [Pavlovales sp. CCMP2436]